MKKLLTCLLSIIIMFSLYTVFATDTVSSPSNNSSGDDYLSNFDDSNTVYLNDYSEYLDMLNQIDYNEEYKYEYEKNVRQDIEDYQNAERTKIYKAKVLSAGAVATDYAQDQYYGVYYKTTYQPLTIRILEGPYQGEEIEDFNYILTCDSYENIKLPSVKKGDTINVIAYKDSEGNVAANSASFDAPFIRWHVTLILFIISLIVFVIYTGKHGLKAIVVLILLADLALMVAAPSILNGINITLLISVILILVGITIAVLKLGNKINAYVAAISALAVTFISAIMIYTFDSMANLCGITYESTSLMEYIIPQLSSSGDIISVIDFHALSVGITSLIVFITSILIACETMKTYANSTKSKNIISETTEKMKEFLADKILYISSILLVLMIPKYLLLLTNKCSITEIINSEILTTDISRILFAIITVAITVPVTTIIAKLVDDTKNVEK